MYIASFIGLTLCSNLLNGGFQGHGHWVNSLALSTEYILRTGAFDHTGKTYSSPEEMKEVLFLNSDIFQKHC